MIDYCKILLDRNRSISERFEAAEKLGSSKDKKSIDVLVKAMLEDTSPVVRHECAFNLGRIADQSTAPYLKQAVENDPSSFVKHEALLALAELGDLSPHKFYSRLFKSSKSRSL